MLYKFKREEKKFLLRRKREDDVDPLNFKDWIQLLVAMYAGVESSEA